MRYPGPVRCLTFRICSALSFERRQFCLHQLLKVVSDDSPYISFATITEPYTPNSHLMLALDFPHSRSSLLSVVHVAVISVVVRVCGPLCSLFSHLGSQLELVLGPHSLAQSVFCVLRSLVCGCTCFG